MAEVQTAGRGRQGRSWISPRGGLYLSVLLRPASVPGRLLPLAAGVAASEALLSWGVPAQLKWPNDLLVGERKIGGILAEASSSGLPPSPASGAPAEMDFVVVGIGINLETAASALPEEATSVRGETGNAPSREEAAAAVLQRLRVWYGSLLAGRGKDLVAAWRERALPWWGEAVFVTSGGRRIRGVARDIDAQGALILETEGGRLERIVSGEVSRLRRA